MAPVVNVPFKHLLDMLRHHCYWAELYFEDNLKVFTILKQVEPSDTRGPAEIRAKEKERWMEMQGSQWTQLEELLAGYVSPAIVAATTAAEHNASAQTTTDPW
ncbi:hypothetical protein FQN52_007138 [Onygenales sp. PD_12]|nr:hypothetical protein FQN52_007138 [Onygenales sp. PD_12]